MKQVFATYDPKEDLTDEYKYCPFCGTKLSLDNSGNKLRPKCPNCGFIHYKNPSPAVTVFVVEEGKVLLGKRTEDLGVGKWALPSGYIEYEDDFLTAAIREVKEETGLDVEIQSIINVESAFISPKFHFLTIYLLARVIGGELNAGDDLETVDWFPLSEPLPEMAFQPDVNIIRGYSTTGLEGLPVDPNFASRDNQV